MELTIVTVFSEPSNLSLSVVENLLANRFNVRIITDDPKQWVTATEHISKKDSLAIYKYTERGKNPFSNYVLAINKALKIAASSNSKILLVLSSRELLKNEAALSLPENIAVVYVGDLVGPRMDFNEDSRLGKVIKAAIEGKIARISQQEKVRPVFAGDVARLLTRWLFSFGNFGEEVLLISKERSLAEICRIIKGYLPSFSFVLSDKPAKKEISRNLKTVYIDIKLDLIIKETLSWFGRGYSGKKRPFSKKAVSRSFWFAAPVLSVLITPLVFTILAGASLFLAKDSLLKGNLNLSRKFSLTAEASGKLANTTSSLISYAPGMSWFYRPLIYSSRLAVQLSEIGIKSADLYEETALLGQKVLGDETYDPQAISEKIGMDIDDIDKQLAFVEGEMKDTSGFFEKKIAQTWQNLDFSQVRRFTKEGKGLSEDLPELLGKTTKKTYLLLLQNNMELRPTGGFIGSFALISFAGGRLVDISVQDVYSADGQLKGHVEPPLPIKQYLKEANWYLRDSNWDPDFPTSAVKIEWFLDKEIDVAVDGVMAVDLEIAKDLLEVLGPVRLNDFQTEITSANLYEKTQAEVEKDFFAGSYKKSSFLTSLTREILSRVSKLPDKDFALVAKTVFQNLEDKHIQIFMHSKNAQKALNGIGWDGSFTVPPCQGLCFSDWFGTAEANLGVNKANYFISRNYVLEVNLNQQNSQKQLIISYENKANPALGNKGVYKAYLRLIFPNTAVFLEAKIRDNGNETSLSPEETMAGGKSEAGFYFEILPGQKKDLVISWRETADKSLDNYDQYQLFWRKQAGLGDEPAKIAINKKDSLTGGGQVVYNTNLARDFISRISWLAPRQ